ncbi:hypothetical protein [Spirosoma koreense]
MLTTEAQCIAYLAAYGDMHRLKLDRAFTKFFTTVGDLSAAPIEIIDWGCGQGLGSGVLIDYIREHALPLSLSRVTLVEPSKLALNRAIDHLTVLLGDDKTEIRSFNQNADILASIQLSTDSRAVKIHLFSNLLDMPHVDYTAIARTIRATHSGENWFVCVSPAIADFRNRRLREFRDQFATARTLSDRTDHFVGNVYRVNRKAYLPYSIKRTECLFTVQL